MDCYVLSVPYYCKYYRNMDCIMTVTEDVITHITKLKINSNSIHKYTMKMAQPRLK